MDQIQELTEPRTCRKCGFVGETTRDFPLRSEGRRRYSCFVCWRKYQNGRYDEGKSAHYRTRRRNEARRYVYEYLLAHPCVDCGEPHPACLDFDHVRGQKFKTIRDMVADCFSTPKIQTEIDKCDVRCANCHRKKTAKDFKWYRDLMRSKSRMTNGENS